MTAPAGTGRSPERGVEAIVRGARRSLLARAAGAGLVWLGALAGAVLAAAWLWTGSGGWEAGSAAPLLLDLALLAGIVATLGGLGVVARRRYGQRRVAEALDRAASLPQGTTQGSLELIRSLPPGVSPGLALSAERRVLEGLPRRAERSAGGLADDPGRWLLRGVGVLILVGGLSVFLGVQDPDRARTAWAGLVSPAAVLAVPELPPLRVTPGSGELPRGTLLQVRVEAPGRDRVELRWQFSGDVARSREASVAGELASFALGTLTSPVELRAHAPDGARSEVVRIRPRDPLLVTDLTVEVRYPPHTGRGTERYRRQAPPLTLPVGSRIGLDGRASGGLATAALRPQGADSGSTDVELTVEEERFTGLWRPTRGGTWAWDLRDPEGGTPGALPAPLELTLVADSVPSIELLFPGQDTVLALDRRQPLVIRARDDYGLESLELVSYRVSAFGDRGSPVTRRLETGGTRAALARPVLDVSDWDLLPGDTVRYRARVADNAPRRHTARTREYVLRVPRSGEMAGEARDRLAEAARAVDSLRQEAGRAVEETRDLERRSAERRGRAGAADIRASVGRPGAREEQDEASFEDRREVEQALERQAELLEGTDSLIQELRELARETREAGMADPELQRDLEELRSLLEEVARAEDREEVQELQERLDAMDREELSRALRSVFEDHETLRERLSESLERFRRAAAEQDFRATAQQARELAREEEALAEAMEDEGAPSDRRAQQQEELRDRADALEEGMEALEERLTRLGEHDARSGVEGARQASSSAEAAMDQASRSSRRGQRQRAGESARQAAGSLRESADRLDRARNEMGDRLDDAVGEALRRTATEALSLARRQSDLREGMVGAGSSEIARLRGDEAALLEGVRNLSGQAAGVAALAPGTGRALAEAVGDAEEAVSRTLEALDHQGARGESPSAVAEEAVGALNRLAMAASNASQGGQGQGQSASGQGQQLMEQLQGLARRQGGLAEQSGSLSSMDLGEQSLRRQLEEMARRQDAVADDLGELARQEERGGGEQLLGDLRTLRTEAQALAERLAGGRLDAATRRRQERLFHRLLDAGRSLEKDEEARERESRTADAVEPAVVEPLTEEALGGPRYGIPDAALLRTLPPAQRALVIRYFERLNRASEVAPPPREPNR